MAAEDSSSSSGFQQDLGTFGVLGDLGAAVQNDMACEHLQVTWICLAKGQKSV